MLKYLPFVLVAAAVPASAQIVNPQQQAAQESTTQADPLDKVVCRTEETIGSRLKKHKVCATMREWKEQQEASRDELELYQQRGQAVLPSG